MNRTAILVATILPFAVVPSCALGPSAAATARDGSRLALFKPANQWLRQGSPNRIALIVERTGFRDAVEVNFLNLPKGVRVDDKVIPEGLTAKDFVLVAGTDAEIVADHPVTIEVKSHGLTTSQVFLVTVRAK